MQQQIMNLLEVDKGATIRPNTRLSFKAFVEYVNLRFQDETSVRKELWTLILEKFDSFPELKGDIQLEDLPKYRRILDLVYIVLTSMLEDEYKGFWGLCMPMSPVLFYGTDPFYNILNDAKAYDQSCGSDDISLKEFNKNRHLHFYSAILKRFYDLQYINHGELIRSLIDSRTQLKRHYRLHLNTDFVEIKFNGELPGIDYEVLRNYAMAEDSLNTLSQLLPLNKFELSGFTIITVTDVTPQYALESIRDTIFKNKTNVEDQGFARIIESLKELVGSNDVVFNILPLFKVNGRLIEDLNAYYQSILFTSNVKDVPSGCRYLAIIEEFIENPRMLFYSDLDKDGPSNKDAARMLSRAQVKSYALIPGFYNNKLVGAIEVYSLQKGVLNESMLTCLESARGLLSQLMFNSVTAFEDEIADVIKEKFTSLQRSVQWKFNEVAWRYLQKRKEKPAEQEIEEIGFENVYPIYGAVDIRNSTIERNGALQKDISLHLDILLGCCMH
jgi:hypothetical protein